MLASTKYSKESEQRKYIYIFKYLKKKKEKKKEKKKIKQTNKTNKNILKQKLLQNWLASSA